MMGTRKGPLILIHRTCSVPTKENKNFLLLLLITENLDASLVAIILLQRNLLNKHVFFCSKIYLFGTKTSSSFFEHLLLQLSVSLYYNMKCSLSKKKRIR